jgi:hypothetical protein
MKADSRALSGLVYAEHFQPVSVVFDLVAD